MDLNDLIDEELEQIHGSLTSYHDKNHKGFYSVDMLACKVVTGYFTKSQGRQLQDVITKCETCKTEYDSALTKAKLYHNKLLNMDHLYFSLVTENSMESLKTSAVLLRTEMTDY